MSGRALVLQQQADAPPALLADWAHARSVDLLAVRADLAPRLPSPRGFDCAVVLGSDEHADDLTVPWIVRELDWLRAAGRQALPMLGICFGAQALAVALGGAVRAAPEPEIGWVRVATDDPQLVEEGPWFTWHEDVIVVPPGALEIARNSVGVQAFLAGPHLGVQFHPEVTTAVVEAWSASDGATRQLAAAAQDPELLVLDARRHADAARGAAFGLFDAFLARARRSAAAPAPEYHKS